MPQHLFADILSPERLSLHDRVMLGLVEESQLPSGDKEVVGLAHEKLIQELGAFILEKSIYFEVMLE